MGDQKQMCRYSQLPADLFHVDLRQKLQLGHSIFEAGDQYISYIRSTYRHPSVSHHDGGFYNMYFVFVVGSNSEAGSRMKVEQLL